MSTPESPSSPPTAVRLRLLRWLALAGLALGVAFVLDLLWLTILPEAPALLERLFSGRAPTIDAGLPVAIALLVLSPIIVGLAVRRLSLRSLRGWVSLALIVAMVAVGNLVMVAFFPSVFDGFMTLAVPSFWAVNGLSLGLVAAILLAIGYASWLVRPHSLRSWVILGLAIAAVLTFALVLVAFFPALVGAINGLTAPFFASTDGHSLGDLEIGLFLVGFMPLAVLTVLWRLQRRSGWWIGGGYLALVPVLAYLAVDDPAIRHPVTMDEIAPAFPGAETSFAVLMRYGNQHPLGREFRTPSRFYEKITAGQAIDPGKPEEWKAWLTGHRSDIEADWADMAPVRTWWTELNAFDRIGDLTPTRIDAELVAFGPLRSMTQHGCAIASLQALDGHGDEAVDTLLPILQVGRKLQPSARTLVRRMIAIIVERMTLQTAGFVLDHAAVSPAARARLTAALAAPGGGPQEARNLIAVEYAFMLGIGLNRPLGGMFEQGPDWLRWSADVVGPFVFNRRATFNIVGEYAANAQELLANREFARMDPLGTKLIEVDARPRFKNLVGAQLVRMMIPGLSKVGESYWKTQDSRAALLARLTNS